jgi:hypothetical protein
MDEEFTEIEVHSYEPGVGAKVTMNGDTMNVPEAPGNRHWEALLRWVEDGHPWPVAPEPSLADLKKTKLAELARIRWEHEVGGMEVAGLNVPTDSTTTGKLTAARIKADADPDYVLSNWKVAPGAFIALDAATIIAVSDAVYDHVQLCFDREAALSGQIMAAQNAEQLDAVELSFDNLTEE